MTIQIAEDGSLTSPPVTLSLRTDMWPFWLEDAIDAAVEASQYAALVPTLVASKDQDELTRAMTNELRSAMRSISSAAFAVDGFYAAVKARSPEHPQQSIWAAKGTRRASQISATFAYHLKLNNTSAKMISKHIKTLFHFRSRAVHLDSKFREAIYRPDIDAGVDWHFMVFRAENAVNATRTTVQMLDQLVGVLDRGSTELSGYTSVARTAMNQVLDRYEATPLPKFGRREPAVEGTE